VKQLHLASVSFVNARPLIEGLDGRPEVRLSFDVPARLLAGLLDARFDVALLPVIDYQRAQGLRIIPSGGIGCDGPTLTVRIFSTRPIETIRTLACDRDSHTSVALARIILAERYGIRPELIEWTAGEPVSADARLLIGDKVVCNEPAGFEHQLDLGEAWKRHTGRPFVFAVWMARPEVELGNIPALLIDARQRGMTRIDEIVHRHAVPRGWPADIARRYFTEYLRFEIGQPQLDAIRLFHQKAAEHGIIPAPPQTLRLACTEDLT
jgi:chorismate dehydratase